MDSKLLFASKKGVDIWVSWVLLLAFVVALSAFMFTWFNEQNDKLAGDLRVMSDTAECDSVGLHVEDICQNAQVLYINISNKNSIRIDQLVFSVFDVYLESPVLRTVNLTLRPSEVEALQVLKQATTQQLEITPVIFTESDKVFCYRKAVTLTGIEFCS